MRPFGQIAAACLVAVALRSPVRSESTEPPGVFAPPAPADLTPDQQKQILKAFRAAQPALRTFVQRFPGAGFSMVHSAGKSSRITIASVLDVDDYSVSLVFAGSFDAGFTKVLTSRCVFFGAYDNREKSRQSSARRPHAIPLEDMSRFCSDPAAFLEALLGRQ